MAPREHGDAHDTILSQVVAGDLEATDVRVMDLAAACPTCRQELDDLLQLQAALDEDARDERASRQASQDEQPGEVDVGSLLHNLARDEQQVPPGAIVRWWIPLAALMLIGGSMWLALLAGEDDATVHELIPLGPGDALVLGEIDQDDPGRLTFHWSAELGAGGYYEVRVWDADDPGSSPWRQRLDLEDNEWTVEFTSDERPRRLRWRVEAFDFFGDRLFERERVESLDAP